MKKYYLLANKEINEIQRYNLTKNQKTLKKVYTTFNAIKDIQIDDQSKGAKNIFVVGLPRCGSTLTESIISANNKVFAAGESKFMRNSLNLSLVDAFNHKTAVVWKLKLNFVMDFLNSLAKSLVMFLNVTVS